MDKNQWLQFHNKIVDSMRVGVGYTKEEIDELLERTSRKEGNDIHLNQEVTRDEVFKLLHYRADVLKDFYAIQNKVSYVESSLADIFDDWEYYRKTGIKSKKDDLAKKIMNVLEENRPKK